MRNRFTVFYAIGKYSEGEHLHAVYGLFLRSTISQDSRNIGQLGNPAAVVFAIELDLKRHVHPVALALM